MEPSPILSGIARQIASQNSQDNEIESLERELGIKSPKGKLQTEDAENERTQIQAAQTEKVQKILDTKKALTEAPPPSAPGQKPGSPVGVSPGGVANSFKDFSNQVFGGAADAVQSMANAGIDLANYMDNKFGNGKWIDDEYKLDFAKDWFPESQFAPNRLVRGATQFLTGYAALGGLGTSSMVAKGVASVASDFLSFEGDTPRVSQLVQNIPEIANPVTEYLAGKPGDTELEKRLKNSLEGLGLGAITEGMFKALKFVKAKGHATRGMEDVAKAEAGIKPEVVEKPTTPAAPVGEPGQIQVPPSDQTNVNPGAIATKNETKVVAKPNPIPNDLVTPVKVQPDELLKSVNTIGKGGGIQVNLTKIDANTDILGAIKNFAEKDAAALEKRIGPSTSEQQLKLLSDELGISVDELMKKRPGEAFNARELYAARVFHASAAENLTNLAKVARDTGSSEAKYQFMNAVQAFRAINLVVTGAKAEAGRALQSLKYVVKADNPMKAELLNDYISNMGPENIDNMVKMVADLPPSAVSKIVRKNTFQKLFDSTFEVYVNNLLSSPALHVTNFVTNAAVSVNSLAERAMAPYFSAGKTGKKLPIDPEYLKSAVEHQYALQKEDKSVMGYDELLDHHKELGHVNKTIADALNARVEPGEFMTAAQAGAKALAEETLASLSGFVDGLRALMKTTFSGDIEGLRGILTKPPEDVFTKSEGIMPAITSDNLGGGGIAVDLLGGVQRLPSQGLDWADSFWKMVNYRGEVAALSHRLGVKQGLQGEELQKFVTQFTNDPPDYIQMMAQKRARINTFTNPLEHGTLGYNLDQIIKTQMPDVQPLRFVVPFVRTPINITKYAIDRTPLALRTREWSDAMAKGGATAQMAKAQMTLGTTILASATLLASQGMITGAGPTDPKMRKQLEESGWSPYSVKVGDSYVSIKKFEPIASYLTLAGDLAEIGSSVSQEWDTRDAQEFGGLLAWAMIRNLGPESALDSFGRFFEAIQEKDFSKFGARIASKTVPLIGMANEARKFSDPYAREVKPAKDDPAPFLQEVLNNIKNQIPGYSRELPNRKNIFGEDVLLPQSIGPDFISPFISNQPKKGDVLMPELIRLGYSGPFAKAEPVPGESHLSITMPPRDLTFAGNHVTLSPQQYSRFVELSAGIGLERGPFGKKTLREALTDLVKSNYEKELPMPKFRTDQAKRIVIKNYINGFRKTAQAQMLQEFPELQNKLMRAVDMKEKAFVNEGAQ